MPLPHNAPKTLFWFNLQRKLLEQNIAIYRENARQEREYGKPELAEITESMIRYTQAKLDYLMSKRGEYAEG